MTRIKVTGLVHPEDADLVAELGVDMIGCVMHPASPRYVTSEQVWDLHRALRGRAEVVGVFVDTPAPLVQRLVDHCRFGHAQLFGSESRSVVEGVRPHAFKAVSVAGEDEVQQAVRTYAGRRSGSPDQPGLLLNLVEDLASDWTTAVSAAERTSLILAAGGLNSDTVGEAVATVRPWAVDTWEAVESAPGRLDPARLEAFVAAVRAADLRLG